MSTPDIFLSISPEAETAKLLAENGFPSGHDTNQLRLNINSSKPNANNIWLLNGEKETGFGTDGMPLMGTYPDSYSRAPASFAQAFIPYPRNDSPSREQASENGARINSGAARHLSSMYPQTVHLLGALVAQKRTNIKEAGDHESDQRPLTAIEAHDVLNGSVAMWSLLAFRKDNRFARAKLPPEVAVMHRTMSGVRMSLMRLFLHTVEHGFEPIDGWAHRPFSSATWTTAVEESGILVSEITEDPTQVCPASAKMIGHVIETIVDPPEQTDTPPSPPALYDSDAQTILEYGSACAELDQIQNRKASYTIRALQSIFAAISEAQTTSEFEMIRKVTTPELRQASQQFTDARETAFSKALVLLGYNPKKFKAATSSY